MLYDFRETLINTLKEDPEPYELVIRALFVVEYFRFRFPVIGNPFYFNLSYHNDPRPSVHFQWRTGSRLFALAVFREEYIRWLYTPGEGRAPLDGKEAFHQVLSRTPVEIPNINDDTLGYCLYEMFRHEERHDSHSALLRCPAFLETIRSHPWDANAVHTAKALLLFVQIEQEIGVETKPQLAFHELNESPYDSEVFTFQWSRGNRLLSVSVFSEAHYHWVLSKGKEYLGGEVRKDTFSPFSCEFIRVLNTFFSGVTPIG